MIRAFFFFLVQRELKETLCHKIKKWNLKNRTRYKKTKTFKIEEAFFLFLCKRLKKNTLKNKERDLRKYWVSEERNQIS